MFNDFHIDTWESLSKDQLIKSMTEIVEEWLERRPDELFGKLYRLDILEVDIKKALQSDDPIKNIAVLIIERQYQKYKSRQLFKPPPINDEDKDLAW